MMQEDDVQALRIAVETLEHPRLAARLTEIAGKPIELFNRALPETASRAIAVPPHSAERGAKGGASHNGKRAKGYFQLPAQGAGGNIGCCRRQPRAGSPPDRTSDLHRHHAALNRRHRPR